MHAVVQNLLAKEVSRKEFIALVISGILSVVGVSALLSKLGQAGQPSVDSYGGSAYGGAKPKSL